MKYLQIIQQTLSRKILLRTIYTLSIMTIIFVIVFLKLQHEKELENIALDEYNFEQLEKVKKILSEIPRGEYTFRNLPDFNKKLKQDIDPKNDCYYLVATKYFIRDGYEGGDKGYIFGTKIHSRKFLKQYPDGYYAYPKYDLPSWERCFGDIFGDSGDYFCYDQNFVTFENIISKECLD